MGGLSLLYDLVGTGMRAFTSVAFAVRVLGAEHLRLRPRLLLVSTHRSDHDVPVICGQLYFSHGSWRQRDLLPHFAVRDDLFLPGFFAGYPPWRSDLVRRLLWPFDAGRRLAVVRGHPIRSANEVKLVEVFRAEPDAPVAELAPPEAAEALAARGVDPALPAREALRGEVADLLWRTYRRDELASPVHERLWGARRRAAAADLRALVDALAGGGTLLLFPEGRPSPDGEIGPLRRGVAALVRRARPDAVLPIALAYDPLVRGRTCVYLSVAEAVPPPEEGVEEWMLALLRRTMPLTAGQLGARALLEGREPDAKEEVELALAEGRPVAPELLDPAARAERLREAAAAGRSEATLRRLAREYASAREAPLVETPQ